MRQKLAFGVVVALMCVFFTGTAAEAAPPTAAPAAVVTVDYPHYYPSGGQGSDFWYQPVLTWAGWKTAVYVRYSWTRMWYIKSHMGTPQAAATAVCGFMPTSAGIAACVSAVSVLYWRIRSLVNQGIAEKRCLRIRFPAPPLYGYVTYQATLVTCRI